MHLRAGDAGMREILTTTAARAAGALLGVDEDAEEKAPNP